MTTVTTTEVSVAATESGVTVTTAPVTVAVAVTPGLTQAAIDTALLDYLLATDFAWANLTGKPSAFVPATHATSHQDGGADELALDASQITAGTLGTARLPSQVARRDEANALAGHVAIGAAVDAPYYTDGWPQTLLVAEDFTDLTAGGGFQLRSLLNLQANVNAAGATEAGFVGLNVEAYITGSGSTGYDNAIQHEALAFLAYWSGPGNIRALWGAAGSANAEAGTVGEQVGTFGQSVITGTAHTEMAVGVRGYIGVAGSSTVDDARALHAQFNAPAGTLGTVYGLKVENVPTATTRYAIHTGTGPVHFGDYLELPEMSDPAAATANTARLYCRDNGSGKSEVVVRFPSGAVQVIASEP